MPHISAPLILASGSPRRKELLLGAELKFEVVVSDCDETPIVGEDPQTMVERLAFAKASAVARHHVESYVIGADTTVYVGAKILGKPQNESDAFEMLKAIQGRTHTVWGGIAIVHQERGIARVFCDSTTVKMAPMNDEEIRWYVQTKEPMDKAGSYAIQGIGLQFVEYIEGSYSNVVGLNLCLVMNELRSCGAVVL